LQKHNKPNFLPERKKLAKSQPVQKTNWRSQKEPNEALQIATNTTSPFLTRTQKVCKSKLSAEKTRRRKMKVRSLDD
jgi:hypothetical protein